jgi:hypothetical protein
MGVRRIRAGAAACALALAGCGCGGGDSTTSGRLSTPSDSKPEPLPAETVAPSHCSVGHPACRETVGRIVYVEANDPDGDGDAHFVILDPQGITFRGLTSIDVRADLRPHPLPGPGDLVSAAGPVQTGSFGQHQIHAMELHVGR